MFRGYYSVYLVFFSLFTKKYKSSQQMVCRGLSIMQSCITNYKSSRQTVRHGLSIIQSYITNYRNRLFVTVYRLCSHILQIIATDCSSPFIDYAVIYYKLSQPTVRHGLSIMQSYITNRRYRLFITFYRLCSHILQIIATDCSSPFIDYAVIYYKSSRQIVWQCLSIIKSYITNHRGRLFLHVYPFCSFIQLTSHRGMIYIFQSLTKNYEVRRLCSTHLRISRPPIFW